MTFSDLGLSEPVLKAVTEAGYVEPTPVQAQAIPYVLMGRDLLAVAQTGTGKTAGFTLPLIDILADSRARARMPGALILEPTRELADQVASSFDKYGKYTKLSKALLIGGVSFSDQEKALDRGVNVLIATPGRLLDHFERGGIMLNDVKTLVIDEADRMLDMGFMPDVERIVKLLPQMRQTLFFSATMAPEMRKLTEQFLSNPKEISVARQATAAETVAQGLLRVSTADKRDVLRQLIRKENVRNAIVFCNRKRDVQILHKSLDKHKFSAGALHGDMSQPARMETLAKFKAGDISILVASDVAARGIDIQGLSHVFNFDVPIHSEDYVHRIGRTGRAGAEGHAFTLATADESKYVQAIERMMGKAIPVVTLEGYEPGAEDERPRDRRGRRGAKPAESRATSERAPAERAPAERAERAPAERKSAERKPQSDRRPAERKAAPEREAPRPIALDEAKANRRRPRERANDEADDQPVLAFGDHIPAFLLRPVIRKSA